MRVGYLIACPCLVAAATVGGGSGVRAAAEPAPVGGTYAINGAYTAVSDGQWAKTVERFDNQDTVTSTWTFNTMCPNPYRCTGQVSSDQGWSAPTHSDAGTWYVTRDIEHWQVCDDGTSGTGHQMFMFYPQDVSTLAGMDKTIGDSGVCGHSRPLVVEMPFTLSKVS